MRTPPRRLWSRLLLKLALTAGTGRMNVRFPPIADSRRRVPFSPIAPLAGATDQLPSLTAGALALSPAKFMFERNRFLGSNLFFTFISRFRFGPNAF